MLVACAGSSDDVQEGEVGSEELVVVPPDGWVDLGDELEEEFVAIYEAPGADYGRLGVMRAGDDIPGVEPYVNRTSEIGAAMRGLEPETIQREFVDIDGADEALEIEFTSTQPLDDAQRIRTLQVAIMRTDGVLFDARIEMAEDAWDAELAREVIDSVRLIDPPS